MEDKAIDSVRRMPKIAHTLALCDRRSAMEQLEAQGFRFRWIPDEENRPYGQYMMIFPGGGMVPCNG